MYQYILKGIFDFLIAFFSIVLLSPILILLAVIIKCSSQGPVFFRQQRIGKNKKEFAIFKFRTMYINTPEDMPTHMLDNPDVYITPIGKFLRKTSLDELPQLFNILMGKMALIGPRPALYNQDDLVAERDRYGANNIKPGLTGWAQINGRDELPIIAKAKLDGEYVKKISFAFDIEIFFKTILSVLKSDGVKEGKSLKNLDSEETGKTAKINSFLISEEDIYFEQSEKISKQNTDETKFDDLGKEPCTNAKQKDDL